MSRRSCAIEWKIRQYMKPFVEVEGSKRVLKYRRPDRAEARAAVTRPGKFPRRIEKEVEISPISNVEISKLK